MDIRDSVQAPREDPALFWSSFCGAGTDFELVASSDEAGCSLSLEPVADLVMDPEAWKDSKPEAWADSDPEA
ncbi:hypothetical protein H5410_035766 [Solanum commersonii]|uniref:Uncharacterized protein n=1 Tax=Solanum commersonii TaxID=4109 RepID=A0A9J5Y658_SOLCO|nr:hypothetical protein H5410_035766 [Solanum commersonii]